MFEWVCVFDDQNGDHGVRFFGMGDDPQMAWENLLADNALETEDVIIENVAFYNMSDNVFRVTRVEWIEDIEGDSDE